LCNTECQRGCTVGGVPRTRLIYDRQLPDRQRNATKWLSLNDQFKDRMNIESDKLDIIQWLARINDSKVIKQFVLLKRLNEEQISVNVNQKEKEAIDKGLKSIGEGRTKSHEQVTDSTQKKYPQLFK
jgi:hypothetical protein